MVVVWWRWWKKKKKTKEKEERTSTRELALGTRVQATLTTSGDRVYMSVYICECEYAVQFVRGNPRGVALHRLHHKRAVSSQLLPKQGENHFGERQ